MPAWSHFNWVEEFTINILSFWSPYVLQQGITKAVNVFYENIFPFHPF